jgi:hypothetical protein
MAHWEIRGELSSAWSMFSPKANVFTCESQPPIAVSAFCKNIAQSFASLTAFWPPSSTFVEYDDGAKEHFDIYDTDLRSGDHVARIIASGSASPLVFPN